MNSLRPARSAWRHWQPLTKQRCIHTPSIAQQISRRWPVRASLATPPRQYIVPTSRLFSQITAARQEVAAEEKKEDEDRWANTPAYEMTFTCKQCNTRSSHKISKQGYHHGTVLITCPGCKNRHLISDHLKIFSDERVTLEDIMKEKGQLVKRGTLGTSEDGDVEFWEDGTEVKREPKSEDETKS